MRHQLARLATSVLRMVGVFHIRLSKDDADLKQQLVQLNVGKGGPRELEGTIDDVPRMGHYGLHYRPPDGSEAVAIFLNGHRTNGIVIATGHRETRPTDLEPGEVMIYHGPLDIWVRLCADGKIRSKGEWLHDGAFKATGDVLDHSADNAATMKVHRDAFNAHKHGGVTAGGAMTGITDHTAP